MRICLKFKNDLNVYIKMWVFVNIYGMQAMHAWIYSFKKLAVSKFNLDFKNFLIHQNVRHSRFKISNWHSEFSVLFNCGTTGFEELEWMCLNKSIWIASLVAPIQWNFNEQCEHAIIECR